MAAKSANLYARIEPEVKEQAENILSTLGIPASSAINMFYKQIILNRGLPFEVKIPETRPVSMDKISEEELNAELEKGYADMVAGRTKPARQAFADILDRRIHFLDQEIHDRQESTSIHPILPANLPDILLSEPERYTKAAHD